MAKNFRQRTSSLLDTVDKVSSRLTGLIKLEDAFMDQMMEIKQLAWVLRNVGGDVSVMVSAALAGRPIPA